VQASYLITFRDDATGVRRHNLETVLTWLNTLPVRAEIEVIVVEQSSVPTIDTTDDMFRNVRVMHAFNAGAFSKSWGFNFAARCSTTPWLFFADADMLLPEGLEESLDLLARGVEVVKPYTRLLDLSESETNALDDGVLPAAINAPDSGAHARQAIGEHVVLAGGIFAIQSKTFAKLGGFDERFVGWGGEDNAMTLKIQRARPSTMQLDALGLHLFHPRDVSALRSNPQYQRNLSMLDQYRYLPDASLFRMFEIQKQLAGNPRKYSPPIDIEIGADA
jgi:predicted glycosyltransferase involved in capsule biosynthesis